MTDKKQQPEEEEELDRGKWSNPIEFVLSCLNYAVGLGNVWRFPYLCFKNGGGAFLVPYVIMLFTMGLPIFFLELAVGQYSGLGPNKAFQRMAPLFHGLGYCTLIVITFITIYYQVIVAWTLFYIFASFSSELGWSSCEHDFNSEKCYSEASNIRCLEKSPNESWPFTFFNKTCYPVGEICEMKHLEFHGNRSHCYNPENGTYIHLQHLLKRVLASEEYYKDYAMGINGATWSSWGILRWESTLCLLLAWIILFFCLMKGVQSSGKVAYVTAIFPYIMLTALLIRGATLEGAATGIKFYVTPKWELLADATVWGDAASQTFYALGIGCGSLVTLASYNNFNNNCHRDAFLVSITNGVTSVFAGFCVFAIMGYMADGMDLPVNEVISSGPGLAFIAYPEAVLRMPLPQLWSVMFFLMMFTLGLGSQFGGLESITTAIIDQWPWLRAYKTRVVAGTCFACFLLALPMCCSGGVFLFTIMDWNTASWSILIIGLAEVVLVAFCYGCTRFMDNLKEMGIPLSRFTRMYWRISWMLLSPISLIGVLVFTLYFFTPARYGSEVFPHWVDALGWLIGITSLVPLPAFALYHFFRGKEVGWELLRPSKLWGPSSSTTSSSANLVDPSVSVYENNAKLAYENISFHDNKKSSLQNDGINVTDQEKSEDGGYENIAFQSSSTNTVPPV